MLLFEATSSGVSLSMFTLKSQQSNNNKKVRRTAYRLHVCGPRLALRSLLFRYSHKYCIIPLKTRNFTSMMPALSRETKEIHTLTIRGIEGGGGEGGLETSLRSKKNTKQAQGLETKTRSQSHDYYYYFFINTFTFQVNSYSM